MEKQITAVLIDTSAYHNRQCDFSGITSAMIPMFLRLMEHNHIPVLSHPILDNEIRKHIKESQILDRAKDLCKSIKKSKAILASVNISAEDIMYKADAERIEGTLTEAYKEFAENFIMLPYVDAQEVFADYFSTKPPFSATGDKKSEFPDAFVLKGLLKYCNENVDEQVLVVSSDPDWEKTLLNHAQIHLVKTLKDALAFLWKQLNDKAEFVWQIWSAKALEISEVIAHKVESEAFTIDDIYELEDIEISNIEVSDIAGDMTPLEITEDSVLIHVTATLSVDGTADYLDESRSAWDKEDSVYYFMAYSRMHFKDAFAEVECEVRLNFPADGSMKPIVIDNVRVTNKWDIEISTRFGSFSIEDITDYGEDDWRAEMAEALEAYHNH